MTVSPPDSISAELVSGLESYIDRSVARCGGSTRSIKPSHRVKFHWPPHPVSYSFHVLASDWTGRTTLEVDGETFEVTVARTPNGVFGRIRELWHEDRGLTEAEMLQNLAASLKPLFERQRAINEPLGQEGRFTGHIRALEPLCLLELLYCRDRDVANEARVEIETRASSGIFFPALIAILRDRRHPHRRSAQWCVLDLFEDLPSFCCAEVAEVAISAIRDLIWDAEDDYARTIYKAGVVLGGHIPYDGGGQALMSCLDAPSKIGRRAAIHGLFHLAEWAPALEECVKARLLLAAENDPEPLLREYAWCMARDIEAGDPEHVPDVLFSDE